MSINTFGSCIPFNTDLLPERGVVGVGTEWPVGFTLEEICKYYWTVRSFRVSAGAVNFADYFSIFMAGGGASGTVLGSLTGITLASMFSSGNFLTGRTKIATTHTSKIRRTISEIRDGITQGEAADTKYNKIFGNPYPGRSKTNPLEVDAEEDPNIFGYFNNDINEGSISGAGPYHRLSSGGGFILIDFSQIILSNRLYWPKIIILLGPTSGLAGPIFSSAITLQDYRFRGISILSSQWNVQTIVGISFRGAVIQMFGSQAWFPGLGMVPTPILGSINIGSNPCDRFFWDGFEDKDREGYTKEKCDNISPDKSIV